MLRNLIKKPWKPRGRAPGPFTGNQRAVALLWGILCHGVFALAVTTMAVSLHRGMHFGLGPFHGATALAANGLLLLQFAGLHSWLLSEKGRTWLGRFPLRSLGPSLSTTTFAIIAALQLLLVFLLWSPSRVVWFQPHGSLLLTWTLGYVGCWALLLRAMQDSGLALQTGALGWYAVWRNRSPRYPAFGTRGLYRHTRQPVYVAFALILWAGPVWTLDHLLIAVAWTGYCLFAPRWKERRYHRRFGDEYRRYAEQVPYWIPRLKPSVVRATGRPAAMPEEPLASAPQGQASRPLRSETGINRRVS